jgi:hypothetical protein
MEAMTETAKNFFERLIHRPIPILLCIFYAYQMNRIVDWYMANPDVNYAESGGLAAVVIGAVAFFKFYVESGDGS